VMGAAVISMYLALQGWIVSSRAKLRRTARDLTVQEARRGITMATHGLRAAIRISGSSYLQTDSIDT